MKRLFWFFLSVAFPWIVMLAHDNPGAAFATLVMQATVIGWIPASIWAYRIAKEAGTLKKEEKRREKQEKKQNK